MTWLKVVFGLVAVLVGVLVLGLVGVLVPVLAPGLVLGVPSPKTDASRAART